TEAFKQLAANRYKIEAKNSELKNGHGYDTASTVGLFGMEIQGAVNLKRILKLLNENE
ncbi:IS5/IS1182 family transposase, partial [Lysinibacillus sp. CNPSo 3705]|nr:IS5/IS1182 family transposase [Lysinibacillus sp. CNPSo 3705]